MAPSPAATGVANRTRGPLARVRLAVRERPRGARHVLCYVPRAMLQRVPRSPDAPRAPRPPRTPRKFPAEAALLFAVGFVLRAAYTWAANGRTPVPYADSADYDTIAWNLARGAGFALNGAAGPHATAFRPPVVPWLTSLLYRVTGHDFFAALLLQCALGALVAPALASYAKGTFGPGVAKWAGWLAALCPLLVFFSGYLLTETTFALLLVVALHLSAEWIKTPRPGRALGAGLAWGVATLTRPTALPLPLLVALWAWFPLGLTVNGRDRVRQVAMLLLGVALAIGPWTLRNAAQFGAFVPVTTGGGRALLDANNPLVWDDPQHAGGAFSVYHLEPYAARYRGLSEVQADALSTRLAKEFLAERRAQWPAMAAAKLARTWRLGREGGGSGTWAREGSPVARLLAVADPLLLWSLVAFPLALAGVWVTLRGPKRLFLSLPLVAIGFFTALVVVYWGALRMRVPIEPLVVLYAAAGADALWRAVRLRRSGLTVIEGRGNAA